MHQSRILLEDLSLPYEFDMVLLGILYLVFGVRGGLFFMFGSVFFERQGDEKRCGILSPQV